MNIQDRQDLYNILDDEICTKSRCSSCILNNSGTRCLLTKLEESYKQDIKHTCVTIGEVVNVCSDRYLLSANRSHNDFVDLINLSTGIGLGAVTIPNEGYIPLDILRDAFRENITKF